MNQPPLPPHAPQTTPGQPPASREATASEPGISEAAPPRPRRRLHLFPVLLETMLFSLLASLAVALLLALSPAGTRWLFQAAQGLSQQAFRVDRVEGTLWQQLTLVGLHVQTAELQLALDRVQLDWQPGELLAGRLHIGRLALGDLKLHTVPSSEPSSLPESLSLPLAVVLEQASLASLQLNGQLLASDVLLRVDSDGQLHRLQLLTARTPWLTGSGALSLAGQRPFALQGRLALQGVQAGFPWQLDLSLAQSLAALRLSGQGSGSMAGQSGQPAAAKPFTTRFDLQLQPFASSPWAILQAGSLDSRGLDLRALSASLPHTALNLDLQARPQGQAVALQLALRNGLRGAWPEARLPLGSLNASLLLDAQQAHIRQLGAELAGGQLQISGRASLHKLDLQAQLRAIDPSQFGGPHWPLSGSLALSGAPASPQLSARLGEGGLNLLLEAGLSGSGAAQALQLRQLQLASATGLLELAGQLGLHGAQRYQLQGQLAGFDPAVLAPLAGRPLPAGALHGRLKVAGQLAPPLQAQLQLDFQPSRLNGLPLQGHLHGNWRAAALEAVDVDLGLGQNQLTVRGGFGRPGQQLQLAAHLPDVADIGPGFHGRLDGQLLLAGSFKRPSLSGTAEARELRLPGGFALASASLAAKVDAAPERPADSPLNLRLAVRQLVGPQLSLGNLQLEVAGSRAAHSIALQAAGSLAEQAIDLRLQAAGALDAQAWQGRIDSLENGGSWPLRLNAPARLRLAADGGELLGLDGQLLGAELDIRRLNWQAGRFAAQGKLRNLALREWLQRLPALQKRFATDLVLAADFDLSGEDKLAGRLIVERQSGDVALSVDDPGIKPMPLRLSAARVEVNLNGDRAGLALELKSAAFGSAAGAFYSRFEKTEAGWRPARGAALEGRLTAEMPSLAWLGPLMGPTARVEGALSAELSASGEIGAPSLFGRLAARDFALRLPDMGINWHEGKLNATVEGDTLQLADFSLKAGKGEATASGRMSLRDTGPEGALTVKFAKFGALIRPDRNLVVSGETNLGVQGEALTLTGKLTADEGLIELPKSSAAKLGDDVVVKGRVDPRQRQARPTLLTLRLDLDLGQKFIFKGQGVDARISGLVRLAASPSQALGASGALKVEEGRYAAYGQNLSISRGLITFQGPLDNPALDILAIRKNLSQEVGVKIVGTALAPRVTLTSEESMTDSDKLSWLVLGRATGSSGSQGDAELLLTAADALFTAGESVSLRQQLATTFGLDDISVGRSESYTSDTDTSDSALTGRVISFGKRLSDKAYVSYEQGLDGVGSAVKFSYQLTRRVSLALSAGDTSAVDVLYSWLFD